jgi:cbb3-type cytochrome oxidase subunit 3
MNVEFLTSISFLRQLATVLATVVFLGIVAWAWSPRKKRDFAEAEQQALQAD